LHQLAVRASGVRTARMLVGNFMVRLSAGVCRI
jgi:hypothetical protein